MAQKDAPVPKYIRFAFGGSAGYVATILPDVFIKTNWIYRMAATLFVQPLDLVKNRMQLSGQCSTLSHVLVKSLGVIRRSRWQGQNDQCKGCKDGDTERGDKWPL